jgi:uncharacterized coiled-coil protein SlyX
VGYQALQSFTNGPLGGGEQLGLCTAVGFQALANATGEANANSGFGYQALMNNTDGPNNTAIGFRALTGNMIGGGNAAIGSYALEDHTEGDFNTAIGFRALGTNMTGSGNTAVGASAGSAVSTADNVICIGAGVDGENVSNSCYIGNIYSNVQPIVGTDPDSVTITANGRLGRGSVSSRRYKHDIQPMDKASEVLYALKPVSFRYNKEYDATQTLAFGLIAEEVAEVYPDMVSRNPQGDAESVRYEQINAMLLNEFLKEHRKVEEQEATIVQLKSRVANQEANAARQQKQIEALTAGLQNVSAQLEASKPALQVVKNP